MTPVISTTEIVRIRRDTDAAAIAGQVYDDLLSLLLVLEPHEWDLATECAPWTVADITRHLIGAGKGHASLREQMRQFRHGAKHARAFDGSLLDATNDLQVRDHAHLRGAELVREIDSIRSGAVDGRMSRPAFIRILSVPNDTGGSTPKGTGRRIKLGHLFDTILTRDVWLHRIDICRATRRTPSFGAHDRRIVEDVIAAWAGRLARGFDLTILTPFAGRYVSQGGGEVLDCDGVELCRVLSGRARHPSSLFDTKVLF